MTGRRTHYQVLGITADATPTEIRRAYHERARELHPDRHPDGQAGAGQAMQDVNEAWRVLRDPARRAAYDHTLAGPASSVGHRADEIEVRPATFRSAVWLALILLMFVAMLVITAYAGGGGGGDGRPSAERFLGSCVRIRPATGVEEVPCGQPNDGYVFFVADRSTRCPRDTTPRDAPGEVLVLCLGRR